MSGKQPHVSPLEARKRLLIAESELNRARLSEEWQMMSDAVRGVVHRTGRIAAWAPPAALVVAGLAAFRHRKTTIPATKSPWFQRILSGARLASTIWLTFRGRGRQEEHPAPPAKPEVRGEASE